MNRRICSLFVAILHLTTILTLATKGLSDEGSIFDSSKVVYQSKQGFKSMGESYKKEVGEYKEMSSRIGSRPPNCDHKCGVCDPCFAIQVPETTHFFGPLFANYEPEGWKCRCGSSFFNP